MEVKDKVEMPKCPKCNQLLKHIDKVGNAKLAQPFDKCLNCGWDSFDEKEERNS